MFKGIIFIFLACFLSVTIYASPAQKAADTSVQAHDSSSMRISLITCGPGHENWESFGHCAIRVIDSSRNPMYRDLTYNYGIFDPFEGSLTEQFLKGRVRVFLSVSPYKVFLEDYLQEGRAVTETVLILSQQQAKRMQTFLDSNALTENKFYTYNILYDNCATRVRDVFSKTLSPGFKYGKTLPDHSRITFRDICASYFGRKYGFRLFGNIFYGCKTDVVMSNDDIMFLPDYLEKGLETATINGRKIGGDKIVVAVSSMPPLSSIMPLIIIYLVLLFTIAGLSFPRLYLLGHVMSIIVLLISSFIGFGILYAWFGAGYDLCSYNFNLLWALPTNIIVPFLLMPLKRKYTIVALCLIVLSIIISFLRIQAMPLIEFAPFWLALITVYISIYRRVRTTT